MLQSPLNIYVDCRRRGYLEDLAVCFVGSATYSKVLGWTFRYQSIRRTITSRRLDLEDGISANGDNAQGHSQAMSDGSGSSSGGEQQRSLQNADAVHHMPAVRFICRPDFFSILHMNQVFICHIQICDSFGLRLRPLAPFMCLTFWTSMTESVSVSV